MNPWNILTKEDINAIHNATLQVLSEVGIFIQHAPVVEMLCNLGAENAGGRLRLPVDLIEINI